MKSTLILTTVVFVAMVFLGKYIFPFDDTDNKGSRERSGLTLFTDYGTGCQYVAAFGIFGLQPRIGVDGKQVCHK